VGQGLALVRVHAGDARAIDEVSWLHAELLPFGPMARLGRHFLRDFCYTILVKDRLLDVVLCRVDGDPAGFIAYTARSITFHRDALRRHVVRAAWTALTSVMKEEDPLARVREAGALMFSRRAEQETAQDPLAELVAIAVRPAFTSPAFVRSTGLRVSEDMLTFCAEEFRREELPRMRMVVDADNKAALFFYQTLGGEFEAYNRGRRPSVQVWFDLDRDLLRPAVDQAPVAPEPRQGAVT
jgi:ribosomal protein S18 acetylase RimI-like enzyme